MTSLAPSHFRELVSRLEVEIGRVMVGQAEVIRHTLIALLADGHVLLEGLPGLGKTMLVRTLAAVLQLRFTRVQFTPDLMPADLIGTDILEVAENGERRFRFHAGPVFTHLLLADEINRATPKTQAALLEAMEERQVTVDGITHALPAPFLVLATQNPVEYQGTFPLPEAQLDRFLLRLRLGYPEPRDEIAILDRQQYQHPITELQPVVTVEELLAAQEAIKSVHVAPPVKRYIVDLVQQTRRHPDIFLGASPRGSLTLYRAGQARAALQGRDFVLPDDIKALAVPALGHRLILGPAARLRDQSTDQLLRELLETVPVPVLG